MIDPRGLIKKNIKLQYTLIFSFVLVILITLSCIAIPSYYLYKSSMIEQLSNSRLDLLAQISNNVKNIQDEVITVSDLYYHDKELLNVASSQNLTLDMTQSYEDHLISINDNFKNTLSNYHFDYNVQLICNNSFTYSSTQTNNDTIKAYTKQLWYSKLMASDEDLFWLSSLTVYGNSPTDQDYFSLIRKINSPSGETLAILMISVNERVIYNTYKDQINDENSIYIVDQEGRIISHPVQSMVGRVFYDMKKLDTLFAGQDNTFIDKLNSEYLFSKYSHQSYDWITIEEIPLKNITNPIKKINTIILLIALFVAIASILLSIAIANSVSKPLSNLYTSMQKAEQGDFNTTFPKEGFQEAQGIAVACESFVKRIVDLHSNLRSKDIEKHKLELDFLQAQINPHFLYNTLFTIKCMVDMKYNEEACTMIDSLTGILKAALGNSGQYTSIESEMELLEQYGFILLKRYKGLFDLEFVIDDATKDLYILHFIIQPILENSIFHGFVSIKSGGLVKVTSISNKDQVLITIEDNGCGMTQAKIDDVFREPTSYQHIGLHNVYKRIKLHYNDAANMTIHSIIDQGTKITITLPKLINPYSEEL